MEKLTEILSSPVVSAVGWTLIHATWQVAVLVLLYVGIKFMTSKATVRYWTGLGLLFSQVFVSIITGFVVYKPTVLTLHSQNLLVTKLNYFEKVSAYFNAHIDLIFGLWLAGVLLLLIKLFVNCLFINQLRNNRLNKFNFKITGILNDVKSQLNITRPVEIFETQAVTIPMIIGTLKPVILLPVSVASGLGTQQLEIIIAHELAHLQRYDFALNIVQSFVEILFFFHPALWFLSAEIRQEREHCCDETAISVNGDRILLAKTLASIQENSRPVSLAMAFGKRKMSLLERVQRILGVNEKRSHAKESLWLMAGLLVVFMAFAQKETIQKTEEIRVVEDVIAQIENQSAIVENDQVLFNNTGITPDTTIKSTNSTPGKIQMWSDKHKIIIDGERILIDGKEQPLSAEQKQTLRKNHAALKASEEKMQPHINEIEMKAAEIEKYADQIEVNVKPIEAAAQKMEVIGRKMEAIVQKYEPTLSSKNTTIGEMEEISKKLGKELAVYEVQMKELDKQMKDVEVKMDKGIEVQMREIEKQMKLQEGPIDKYSNEMEGYMNEIKKLIPAEVMKDFENGFYQATPPPAPRPPRPVRSPSLNTPVSPPPPPTPPAPKAPIKN